MNSLHFRRSRRGFRTKAMAVAAGSLALAVGTSVAASAADGSATARSENVTQARHAAKTALGARTPQTAQDTWAFGIDGRDSAGTIWNYPPKKSGFSPRVKTGTGMGAATALFKNNSANTTHVNVYARFGSHLRLYTGASSGSGSVLPGNWSSYNTFVTPGDLGGGSAPDLLVRDTSGQLFVYRSYTNGKFTGRNKVGSGWNIYTAIAGRDDLTGDGKPDIVARDRAGNLFLFRGTGNYLKPFSSRIKVGTGWNDYNKIIGLGDTNGDGLNDLITRTPKGILYFIAGTGNASAPFKKRVNIGSHWNSYNYLF